VIVLVTIRGMTCVDLVGLATLEEAPRDLGRGADLGQHARSGVDGSGWLWKSAVVLTTHGS
jgi:hypothetical protein